MGEGRERIEKRKKPLLVGKGRFELPIRRTPTEKIQPSPPRPSSFN
jgi:hypothetical protein